MSYDFSSLTPRQQQLLTFQGWKVGDGTVQPAKRTVKKLIERGLIREHVTSNGYYIATEYEVPISVHMAWCAHCAQGAAA